MNFELYQNYNVRDLHNDLCMIMSNDINFNENSLFKMERTNVIFFLYCFVNLFFEYLRNIFRKLHNSDLIIMRFQWRTLKVLMEKAIQVMK